MQSTYTYPRASRYPAAYQPNVVSKPSYFTAPPQRLEVRKWAYTSSALPWPPPHLHPTWQLTTLLCTGAGVHKENGNGTSRSAQRPRTWFKTPTLAVLLKLTPLHCCNMRTMINAAIANITHTFYAISISFPDCIHAYTYTHAKPGPQWCTSIVYIHKDI